MAGRSMGAYCFSPKSSTVAPMVKPPAASATPHIMSKPIQRPQGVFWVRLVVAPRPQPNRHTNMAPQATQSRAARMSSGVSSDFTYSLPVMPSRILSWNQDRAGRALSIALFMATLLVVAGVVLFIGLGAAARESVETHQQWRPERHHERRDAQGALHEVGVRGVEDVGLHRQLLEGRVGDVEPVGPAGLMLAVDVLDVLVGVAVDALARLGDHVFAAAEGEGAARADRGAGGLEPLGLAVGAEGALHHPRRERVVLVLGDAEGAGHHAVAAAHAAGGVVGDRAVRLLVEGAVRAGRGAAWGDAVHALGLGEALGALGGVALRQLLQVLAGLVHVEAVHHRERGGAGLAL